MLSRFSAAMEPENEEVWEKEIHHPAGDVVQKGIAMIDLNDYIAVGQNAIARRVVQQSDASDNYDNDFKSLLATPRLIH